MPADREKVEEQIAALGLVHSWLTRRERACLHKVLSPEEKILAMTTGFLEGRAWLVTVTDTRVLLLDKGILYGLRQMEFPLSRINSVSYATGLAFGRMQITAAGGPKCIEMIWKTDLYRVAHTISGLLGKAGGKSRPSNADFVSQLERLAELKRGGVLTESEFALQKARILQPADAR